MGAAKKRGSLEQRIEEARDRLEAERHQRVNDVAELDALESRQRAGMQRWVDTLVIPQMDRQHGALARVDFTNIPMMSKTEDEDQLKAQVDKLREQYETLRSND